MSRGSLESDLTFRCVNSSWIATQRSNVTSQIANGYYPSGRRARPQRRQRIQEERMSTERHEEARKRNASRDGVAVHAVDL